MQFEGLAVLRLVKHKLALLLERLAFPSLQKYLILTLVALLNLFVMVTLCFLIPYYLNQDKFALGLIAIPGFIFYLCGCLVSIIPLIYLPYYCSNSQIGGSQQDSTCTCQCHIKNTRK